MGFGLDSGQFSKTALSDAELIPCASVAIAVMSQCNSSQRGSTPLRPRIRKSGDCKVHDSRIHRRLNENTVSGVDDGVEGLRRYRVSSIVSSLGRCAFIPCAISLERQTRHRLTMHLSSTYHGRLSANLRAIPRKVQSPLYPHIEAQQPSLH